MSSNYIKTSILFVQGHSLKTDISLLLVRIVTGLAFAHYGSFKIKDPLHWMGEDSVFPAFFQALAAISEFCGGIAWVVGFLTPIASFGIACTMTVAIYMHLIVNGDPFVNFTGGPSYDHPLLLLVIAVLFFLAGPGRLSADRYIFGKNIK